MIDGGEPEFSDKNMSHCHFIYKLHMNWLGIKSGVRGEKWTFELWHDIVKWLVSWHNMNTQTG
jgi:hypothetical protein